MRLWTDGDAGEFGAPNARSLDAEAASAQQARLIEHCAKFGFSLFVKG